MSLPHVSEPMPTHTGSNTVTEKRAREHENEAQTSLNEPAFKKAKRSRDILRGIKFHHFNELLNKHDETRREFEDTQSSQMEILKSAFEKLKRDVEEDLGKEQRNRDKDRTLQESEENLWRREKTTLKEEIKRLENEISESNAERRNVKIAWDKQKNDFTARIKTLKNEVSESNEERRTNQTEWAKEKNELMTRINELEDHAREKILNKYAKHEEVLVKAMTSQRLENGRGRISRRQAKKLAQQEFDADFWPEWTDSEEE